MEAIHQIRAIKEALKLLKLISASGARWSLIVTDEDAPDQPGVLNVYVKTRAEREGLRMLLGFKKEKALAGVEWESHKAADALTVSLIDDEEE